MGTTTLATPTGVLTRPAGEPTDSDLVARVRAGEDRAFELLYERYHRRIAAYIYGMVKDYGRAEDVAQDVFMSALRRMRDTDREIAFKPWIYEIAKNACIDQFRRSRRTEEVSFDADGALGGADAGRLVALRPSPDAALDQKLSLDHLRGAFSGLSQTHHEILVMRELEGLSYREIGQRLGMSRPAVESTLFRARRRLAEEYEELISGERCLRVQAIMDLAAERALGARDRRRLAAHLSHCQGCRRHGRLAGLDDALFAPAARPVRAKIAALLPLPAVLRRRWGGGDATTAPGSGVQHVAQWSSQLGALGDPSASSWLKAVAAAATVAVAGLGATAATQHGAFGGSGDGDRAAVPALTRGADGAAAQALAAGAARRAASGRHGASPVGSGVAGVSMGAVAGPLAVRHGGNGHAPAQDGAEKGNGGTHEGGGSSTTGAGSGGPAGGPIETALGAAPPASAPATTLVDKSRRHLVGGVRQKLGIPTPRAAARRVVSVARQAESSASQAVGEAKAAAGDAAAAVQQDADKLLGGG